MRSVVVDLFLDDGKIAGTQVDVVHLAVGADRIVDFPLAVIEFDFAPFGEASLSQGRADSGGLLGDRRTAVGEGDASNKCSRSKNGSSDFDARHDRSSPYCCAFR